MIGSKAVILTNAVVNVYVDEVTDYNLEAKRMYLSRLDRLVEEQRQHSTDLKGVENRQRQENSSIRNSHASHTGEVLLFGDWLAAEVRRSAEAEDVTGLWDWLRDDLKRPPVATVYRRAEVSGPWPF